MGAVNRLKIHMILAKEGKAAEAVAAIAHPIILLPERQEPAVVAEEEEAAVEPHWGCQPSAAAAL